MNTNRKTLAALAAMVAATVLALGCGGVADNRDGSEQVAPAGTATPPREQPQGEAALPMDGKTAQVYKDGLKVVVTAPTRYRVPAYAAGHAAGNSAFTFKVTVINGTGEQVDLRFTGVDVAVGAEGVAAEQIFADGLSDFTTTSVLAPGSRRTAKLAFSVDSKDLSKIEVTVRPGVLDYADALFAGKVAR